MRDDKPLKKIGAVEVHSFTAEWTERKNWSG